MRKVLMLLAALMVVMASVGMGGSALASPIAGSAKQSEPIITGPDGKPLRPVSTFSIGEVSGTAAGTGRVSPMSFSFPCRGTFTDPLLETGLNGHKYIFQQTYIQCGGQANVSVRSSLWKCIRDGGPDDVSCTKLIKRGVYIHATAQSFSAPVNSPNCVGTSSTMYVLIADLLSWNGRGYPEQESAIRLVNCSF